jgi:inner membrane protein
MPASRKVSSTTGVITVTGWGRLINGSLNLFECILIAEKTLPKRPRVLNCAHKNWAHYTIPAGTVQHSMFNSTHTFVGFTIARTGLDKWVPKAAVTAVIAANLPDIDIVFDLGGVPSYIEHHRGISHSIVGIPLLSLALAAAMYIFTKNFWRTFVLALVVMATHPALDYSNPYGLRPFLPFDGSWYYGDALFILDPLIDFILLLGIVIGAFFKPAKPALAYVSMLVALVYIGARINARDTARHELEGYTSKITDYRVSAVLPRFMNMRMWDGIIGTEDSIVKARIDTETGTVTEVARLAKIENSQIIDAAAATRTARAVLGFARFPVTRVHKTENGYRVTFLDFRFYDEVSRRSFAADVELDHAMNVTNETLAFNESIE